MEPREQQKPSTQARDTLLEELKDSVGEESFEKADVDVDRAISDRPHPVKAAYASSKLLIVLVGATLLTVGVVAALATEKWWLVVVAMVVHGLLTVVVVGMGMTMFSQVENPDPAVVSKLEEEGVEEPERVMNNLVEQAAGEEEGSRTHRQVTEHAGETTPPEEDAAESTTRQQTAMTPASESTRQVGPG